MLFHRFQAWNLAHALYNDPSMGAKSNPFIAHRFNEGFSQGWIRPALWREALEMFVLDETPLLPPDLDIDPNPIKDHLYWYPHVAPDLALRPMGRYSLPELRALKGLILANLNRRGIAMSSADFDDIVAKLDEVPEKIRWLATGQQLHEVELEFSMASLSLELARRGVPTYAHVPPPPQYMGPPPVLPATEPDALVVAKFYFENQVHVPSPPSFSEAVKLRESARIQAWREKIRSWSEKLRSGTTAFNEIKQEIDDANGYIQGAAFPLRAVPRWSAFFTLPMAYYHTFTSPSELSHIFGIFLFAFEAFHFLGEVASQDVRLSDPLQYKWFLVSNNE
jgi:hypothetical protein